MAKKKKKKWTAAEKAAFAKRMKAARKKTAKKTTKRKTKKSTPKKTTAKKQYKRKGVPKMAKKKAKSGKSSGGKKSYRRSRKGGGGLGRAGVVGMVKNALVAIGGGLVAGAVSNKLPIQQPLIKALSPAAAGILLILTIGKRNPLAMQLATGMLVIGGVSAIRAQFPNVPLLAGEEAVTISPDLLGQGDYDELPDYTGVEDIGVEDIGFNGDEISEEEYETAASI